MSDQPQKPLWLTIVISLVMTALLAGIAWAVWTYANSSVQNFAPARCCATSASSSACSPCSWF